MPLGFIQKKKKLRIHKWFVIGTIFLSSSGPPKKIFWLLPRGMFIRGFAANFGISTTYKEEVETTKIGLPMDKNMGI